MHLPVMGGVENRILYLELPPGTRHEEAVRYGIVTAGTNDEGSRFSLGTESGLGLFDCNFKIGKMRDAEDDAAVTERRDDTGGTQASEQNKATRNEEDGDN